MIKKNKIKKWAIHYTMQIYFHDNPKKKIRKEGSNTKLGNKTKQKKVKNEKMKK